MPVSSPFGRMCSAMVTPMRVDGTVDLDASGRLAAHLLEQGHDGLAVSGTTGEAPTTTAAEKLELIRVVKAAVGDRAAVTAGVGTNSTAQSVEAARAAAAAGADALLAVTPYYSKPPQSGVRAHFTAIADATDLPLMVYDIPGRSGIPIEVESLLALADHPRIRAVKDAKGDLFAAAAVMAQTDLLWFSGDDTLNLAHLTQGATGLVSTVGNVAGALYAELIASVDKGDLARARELHHQVAPAVTAIMTITQGAIMAKAALRLTGVLDSAAVRLPLVEATDTEIAAVRAGLIAAGLL